MRFVIHKASESNFEEYREIRSLEELLALIVEFDDDIVVGKGIFAGSDYRIIVYDDCME